MGQRVILDYSTESGVHPSWSFVETDLGIIAWAGRKTRLLRVTIGHQTVEEAHNSLMLTLNSELVDPVSELARFFERFASGKRTPIELEFCGETGTPFQRAILETVAAIPWGTVKSYGEVALEARYPKAARAVGTVMSKNRFPILIPCHRVVAAQGKPGGFSAPSGISLKQRMLQLEAG